MLGQHELLIRLAAGGAANVFLVRDTHAAPPGRLLALKILLPSLSANEDFLNMFFTEARIAARLEHPNIVAIAGFGQVDGIHCLAMEYVFGVSLAQALRASAKMKTPLTVGVLLRITADVCGALHYAHDLKDDQGRSMGLVHRDVTPQNILVGFNGVPKLTDFGIAKATNRGWETQAGIVKGKFSYMSPEQALGKPVDRRSDIFCTGIVLWEALTGRDLFRGGTPIEVLSAIREQKIEPPSKVVPGLTPIVDPIVMKALHRAPRGRYQTAEEMGEDIEQLIAKASVTIDDATISKELVGIYGDEIVNRAFLLRAAMAGRADVEELAKTLGGQKLSPKHLPIIPGGVSNPDPLGLFTGDLSIHAWLQPKGGPIETTGSGSETPIVQGWDDSTAMSVPSDELLSMLSEDDADIGHLPPQFRARFESRDPRPIPRAPSLDMEALDSLTPTPDLEDFRVLEGAQPSRRPLPQPPPPPPGRELSSTTSPPSNPSVSDALRSSAIASARREPGDAPRSGELPREEDEGRSPSERNSPRSIQLRPSMLLLISIGLIALGIIVGLLINRPPSR